VGEKSKTKKINTSMAVFITVITFVVIVGGLAAVVYFNFFGFGTKTLEILRKNDSVYLTETKATSEISAALTERETALNEKLAGIESKEYELTNREAAIIQKETEIYEMNDMLNGKISDIQKLVDIYTNMEPEVAASILELQGDKTLTLNILKNMDSEIASEILSNMTKKIAAQLTVDMMN